METGFQPCPICSTPLTASERYPRYLCGTCTARACSPDGRPLKFYNIGLGGGYAAVYADTNEDYPSHECYVDGVKCQADEARFIGVVVQALK